MRWAFTFGSQYNLADNFVIVEAATEAEATEIFRAARKVATAERFPDDGDHRWAFCYPVDDDWAEQVARYGLTEVNIGARLAFKY